MGSDHLSYYDPDEIEAAVYDLLDMNMLDDAEYLAEQGMRQHPNDETVEKLVIWIYLHNHKVDKADALFQKYKNQDDEWVLRMAFSMSVIHGHPLRALENFLPTLTEGKVAPLDWVNSIDEMFDALPPKVLAPFLVDAANSITDNAEALGRLGSMLIDTHNFREATTVIEKALDLDAYDIFSWQDLARCYLLLQDFPKCVEACDYGLAIEEGNPLLGFIKGYIHYQNLEYKECIPYLTNARKFAEGRLDVRNLNMNADEIEQQINITYEMLGSAYLETEQYDEAKECFGIMTERDPNNASAWMQLASISLFEGNLNEADSIVKKAIELDPKNESAHSLLISILTSMHDFPAAVKELKKIMRLCPKNRGYLFAYAELSRHIGDKKEADAAYRKLLKMGTKDESYKQLLLAYFESIGDDEAVKMLKSEQK